MNSRNLLANIVSVPLSVQNFLYNKKNENLVLSILFHNPSRYLFESIVKHFLCLGYRFISLDAAIDIIKTGTNKNGKSVCITLDDGWRDNLNNVIPIVQKYNIPITIYITTAPLETGCFWWEKVKKYSNYNVKTLKNLSNNERKAIISKIDLHNRKRYQNHRSVLTIDELRLISKLDLVTIGSHTVTHPCLNKTTIQESFFEINESKKIIENYIQKEVSHFAFPNGDYNLATINIVKNAGYKSAATVNYGFINKDSEPFLLNRNSINESGSIRENICHAFSTWSIVNKTMSLINQSLSN